MILEVKAMKDETQKDKKIIDKPEIRVWCHPEKAGLKGEDFYEVFETVQEAELFIKHNKMAEDTVLFAFRGYEMQLSQIPVPEYYENDQH